MNQFKTERTLVGGILAILLLLSVPNEFPYIYPTNESAIFAESMATAAFTCGFFACWMMIDQKKNYVFHWAFITGILFFYYIVVNEPAIQGMIHKQSFFGMYLFFLFPMTLIADVLVGTFPEKP